MKRSENIRNKFADKCREGARKAGASRFLVAVSGGPDSVALLRAMKEGGQHAVCAHCNFHLRGEESERDAEFVANICRKENIELVTIDFDVEKEQQPGESTEMTCRRIRYEWFRKILREKNLEYIAIGHNADDNIETLLMNLLRGSGTNGLKGMKELSGDIFRPLLEFRRKEIESYLDALKQDYVTDHTNLETDFRRNFLRNEVLPLLESRWEGARSGLGRSLKLIQEENKIVSETIKRELADVDDFLSWEKINNFPSPLTLVFRFINRWGGSETTAEEIVKSLPKPSTGRTRRLSDAWKAVNEKNGLRIVATEERDCKYRLESEKIIRNNRDIKELYPEDQSFTLVPYPADRYEIRFVTKGMKLKCLGMKSGSQDVIKVLKDAGIPSHRRANYPVIRDRESGEVIWIPGVKRSGLHLLRGDEEIIYKICIK